MEHILLNDEENEPPHSRHQNHEKLAKGEVLVDDIVYFTIGNVLYLWNKKDQDQFDLRYNQHEFNEKIYNVCYVENYSEDFKPYLCVATKTEV